MCTKITHRLEQEIWLQFNAYVHGLDNFPHKHYFLFELITDLLEFNLFFVYIYNHVKKFYVDV